MSATHGRSTPTPEDIKPDCSREELESQLRNQHLDLAESAARRESDFPEFNSRIEAKRAEHERQRLLQRKLFDAQMKALKTKQEAEERELWETSPVVNMQLNNMTAKSMPSSRRNSRGHDDMLAATNSMAFLSVGEPGRSVSVNRQPKEFGFIFNDQNVSDIGEDFKSSGLGKFAAAPNNDQNLRKAPIKNQANRAPDSRRILSGDKISSGSGVANAQARRYPSDSQWPAFHDRQEDSRVVSEGANSRTKQRSHLVKSQQQTTNGGQTLYHESFPGFGTDMSLASYPSSFQEKKSAINFTSFPNVYNDQGMSIIRSRNTSSDDIADSEHNGKRRVDAEANRFSGMMLEDLKGELYPLCKDQHGCRYLQKQLEERDPAHRDVIFAEILGHIPELMTDPFGNYLCQQMLEFSTDEQRDIICENIASQLVSISLNMHGTRAVQKLIDSLSTSRQICSIIFALSLSVVPLIKDLNGNHVIQKCLNRLNSEDNQFIYNAVASHCVEVATHRHGCCVLQRCIDHASDTQRVQLVSEITYQALTLVQDPFGNYVVQYVLDLNDTRFTDAVIRQFVKHVCVLAVQKFSSNVMEKCIRVAEPDTRMLLLEELIDHSRLEKLLRDAFANYVVQTALEYAEPVQRAQLVDAIKPILPMIRNTPYGKRIQSKLQKETDVQRVTQGTYGSFSGRNEGHHNSNMRNTSENKYSHFQNGHTLPGGTYRAPLQRGAQMTASNNSHAPLADPYGFSEPSQDSHFGPLRMPLNAHALGAGLGGGYSNGFMNQIPLTSYQQHSLSPHINGLPPQPPFHQYM